MAGNEMDHWLQNTRANDTGSIVDVSLGLFNLWLRGDLYGHLPELLNILPLVRLRTSPHSRRYGVTITGLLVTIFPAGQSDSKSMLFAPQYVCMYVMQHHQCTRPGGWRLANVGSVLVGHNS